MFDWIFVTAFKNCVQAVRITFLLIRGAGRLTSALLNRHQNAPTIHQSHLDD